MMISWDARAEDFRQQSQLCTGRGRFSSALVLHSSRGLRTSRVVPVLRVCCACVVRVLRLCCTFAAPVLRLRFACDAPVLHLSVLCLCCA